MVGRPYWKAQGLDPQQPGPFGTRPVYSRPETLEACWSFLADSKKGSKEVFPRNMSPEKQVAFQKARPVEWKTLLEEKKAVRVLSAAETVKVGQDAKLGKRIVKSIYVQTEKDEEGVWRVKARWCLAGHQDPDLRLLLERGELASPTISTLARSLLFQMVSSHKWILQLGDIKGAFLEAAPMDRQIFAEQPAEGLDGVEPGVLIEILLPVCGLNDSPCRWYREFCEVALQAGFEASRLEPCLFLLFSPCRTRLEGVMGVHVDDTAVGGEGPRFAACLGVLRKRVPYRKWRLKDGDFCGQHLQQREYFSIEASQAKFALQLRPVTVRRVADDEKANRDEVSALRAMVGGGAWLAGQTRPDLPVLVATAQSMLPEPTVGEIKRANALARRARQFSSMKVTYHPVPPQDLTLCMHSDSSLDTKDAEKGTQAGWMLGITSKHLATGAVATWTPLSWRSFRHRSPVGSTFAAETKALSSGLGRLEWAQCLVCEMLEQKSFDIRQRETMYQRRPSQAVIYCKSVFDHLRAPNIRSLEDQRAALDLLIVKDSLNRLHCTLRWAPTNRQLADSLTKDQALPADLLRSVMNAGRYQISEETLVLEAGIPISKIVKESLLRPALSCGLA